MVRKHNGALSKFRTAKDQRSKANLSCVSTGQNLGVIRYLKYCTNLTLSSIFSIVFYVTRLDSNTFQNQNIDIVYKGESAVYKVQALFTTCKHCLQGTSTVYTRCKRCLQCASVVYKVQALFTSCKRAVYKASLDGRGPLCCHHDMSVSGDPTTHRCISAISLHLHETRRCRETGQGEVCVKRLQGEALIPVPVLCRSVHEYMQHHVHSTTQIFQAIIQTN